MTDRKPDRATSERALRALAAARLPPYPGFDMAEALRALALWPLPPGADAAVDWQRAAAAEEEETDHRFGPPITKAQEIGPH